MLTEVVIEGVDGDLEENVRKRLSIVEVIDDETVPDSHVAWLHGKASEQIHNALEPFGYYDVSVDAELEQTAAGLRAVYDIDPGEPVRVSVLDVGLSGPGESDRKLQRAIGNFPLEQSEVLDHRRYERGKREISRLLARRGYFDAAMAVHEVVVYPERHAAEVRLHWQTGARYRYGPVQFDGGQFPEEFMQRFVTFGPGEPFHQDELIELQRRLLDTNYFDRVDVNPLRDEAEDLAVPVRVTLAAKKRDVYEAGVGFGTDSGARVEGGFERRWVNQRGHRFRIKGELGQRRSGLESQYGIPVHRGNVRQYTIGARYLDEVSESVDRRGAEFSVGREATWHGWQQIVSLNLLSERFELGSEEQRDLPGATQDATVLYPMLRLSKSRSNDPVVPSRGWRLEFYGRGGHETILSDTSFVQLGGKAKLILPGPGRDRILFRAEAGTTWAENFDRMPASLRFFAGGDRSVRGYDFEALGPVDARGEVEGGEHLLVGSVEYEHMFTEKWGAAVFTDAGNAFSGTDFEPEAGAGVGLRWRSPVGMFRLDVASAVTQPGDPIELHVVIGPDL